MPKIFVCDIPFQLIVSDYLFCSFWLYFHIFPPSFWDCLVRGHRGSETSHTMLTNCLEIQLILIVVLESYRFLSLFARFST